MKKYVLLFIVLTIFHSLAEAQKSDRSISSILKEAISQRQESDAFPSIMSYLAETQLGIPYKAGLLDRGTEEKLIARVDSTDCVLYVENTLAMRMVWEHFLASNEQVDLEKARQPYLMQSIAYLRYRDPSEITYLNRIHYFSGWMHHHTQGEEALFELPFQDMDELPELDAVGFMSVKPELYPRLKNDAGLVNDILEMEQTINQLEPIRYIPKNELDSYSDALQDGDVIAFVSTLSNLDVSHTAILSYDPTQQIALSFYHASTKNGVERYAKGLEHYLKSQKYINGIAVIRMKDDFSVSSLFGN
jgi:hypothetical protein